jgi:chromosomal replication initiator protein
VAVADARQVWQAALAQLRSRLAPGNFDAYLKDTWGVELSDDVLFVAVEQPIVRETLEQRFANLIRVVLNEVCRRPTDVRFVAAPAAPSASPGSALTPLEAYERASAGPALRRGGATTAGSPLNPRYTFATFVVGDSNRLAHAASQAVANSPGAAYNPLFLYGGVGLGKTHLLHAIGHTVRAQGLTVVYVSSETFTNELIEAIREHRTDDFRAKYRRAGVLLIDDIQFIASRERTQEEFFHTFNAIYEAGGQIVLSSDKAPKAIPTLEERLRSRFEWGLIADIQTPDIETRIAILRTKLNGNADLVPQEVLEFIAHKVQSNIRELEGSLNRILAYARLHDRPVTLELATEALRELVAEERRPSVRPDAVLRVVSRYYGVSLDDLRGKARDRKIVGPRQLAMYLLREDVRLSLPEIGALLGGRDHSTVLHGYEKIRQEVEAEGSVRAELRALRELLRADSG